jgi:hypothetical protein
VARSSLTSGSTVPRRSSLTSTNLPRQLGPSRHPRPLHRRLGQAEDKAAAQSAKEVGNNKLRSGDLDGALEAYSNAIELDSTCAVFYANRAAVYTKKAGTENLELAVADCQEAIALDPSYSKAYSRLGLAYYHLGRYEEAVRLSSSPRVVISSLCDPMQSVSTEPGLVRLCGRLLFLCLVCPFA